MQPKLRLIGGGEEAVATTKPLAASPPFSRNYSGFPYDEQGKRTKPLYEEGPVHLLRSIVGIAKNYTDYRMVYDARLQRFEKYKNVYTPDHEWSFQQEAPTRGEIVEFLANIHAAMEQGNAQIAQFLEQHPALQLENFE